MRYSDVMEAYDIALIDPEYLEYREQYKKAETAMRIISLESFLEDFDDDEVVTEAFETVKETFKTLFTWFNGLFKKFAAFIRGIVFQSQEKTIKKMENSINKSYITITKEQLEKFKDDLEAIGQPIDSLKDSMTAKDLSDICKAALTEGRRINENLKKGVSMMDASKDPDTLSNYLKSANKEAKACARVIRNCINLINKAIKKGIVQSKEDEKSRKASANSSTSMVVYNPN